jgi:hypothetical protein
MPTFISKGRTVKEAIELGLEALQLDRTQVEIEVLQIEKKGLLGIGNKEAVVKLSYQLDTTVTSPNPSIKGTIPDTDTSVNGMGLEDFLDYLEETDYQETTGDELSLDKEAIGQSEINQTPNEKTDTTHYEHHQSLSGKVWIKDGKLFVRDSEEHQPSIKLEKGLLVKKNGETIEDSFVFVTESDDLTFFLEEASEPTEWKIVESDDKLQAELHIKPGLERRLKLKDTTPAIRLRLKQSKILK